MLDEATRREMKLVLAQARATEKVLEGQNSALGGANPLIMRVNELIIRARQDLAGSGLEAVVPAIVSPMSGTSAVLGRDLRVAVATLRAGVEEILAEEGDQTEGLRQEIELLKAKTAEAETRSLNLVDDGLRDRCLDLIVRPGKADTAVREAAVVLEDRIRQAAGLGNDDHGVALVDKALSPKKGLLDFGGPESEQQGIHQLYRGVISFFRNPASHRLIEDYDVTRARQVVGLIDLLLQLLRDAKKRDSSAANSESVP